MGDLQKLSFQLFKDYTDPLVDFFPDIKRNLKQAGSTLTAQEYMSGALMYSILAFAFCVPVMSFVFGLLFSNFLFGFMLAVLAGSGLTAAVFFVYMELPRLTISEKAKDLDDSLPFAAMYLSTISSSKLPLFKTLEIFTKFARYGEIVKQINNINEDVKLFGLDISTALERAIERSPSKKFRELLYGVLSTIKSGANMNIYLKEKSISYMADYRRKLYEFSHSLTVYVEIYLTSIVLGAIFFTVLTAIISGISGAGGEIISLQFFLIFVFMPVISFAFIYIIKTSTPGGE